MSKQTHRLENDSRMQTPRMQPLPTVPPLDLVGHVDVRRLRLRIRTERDVHSFQIVVLRHDAACTMARGGDGDDSAVELWHAGGQEGGLEELEEQEVCEVVGGELQLEAVGGLGFRAGHNAGVGHEDVQVVVTAAEEVGGAGADGGEAGKFHGDDFDRRILGVLGVERPDDGLAFGQRASGDEDLGAVHLEDSRAFSPQASGAASDQDGLAGKFADEVLVMDDLLCGRAGIARTCDVGVCCCVAVHD